MNKTARVLLRGAFTLLVLALILPLVSPSETAFAQDETCYDENNDGIDDFGTDPDGDGIDNCSDQCPIDGYYGQGFSLHTDFGNPKYGCPYPDRDGDGVHDNDDVCPDRGDAGFGDGINANGCPILRDFDGDGVPDESDQCPDDGDLGFGITGDGCPFAPPSNTDSDGDGVDDIVDRCPNEGDAGFGLTSDGCPEQDFTFVCRDENNDNRDDFDTDGDGDGYDNCQDVCERDGDRFGFGVDGRGCPLDDRCVDSNNDGFDDRNFDVDGDGLDNCEALGDASSPSTTSSSLDSSTPIACEDSINPSQYQDIRLAEGQLGRSLEDGGSLNFRRLAGTRAPTLGEIDEGEEFYVIGGTLCSQSQADDGVVSYVWWQVCYDGLIGWVAEGDGFDYFVEPVELNDDQDLFMEDLDESTDANDVDFFRVTQDMGQLPVGGQVTARLCLELTERDYTDDDPSYYRYVDIAGFNGDQIFESGEALEGYEAKSAEAYSVYAESNREGFLYGTVTRPDVSEERGREGNTNENTDNDGNNDEESERTPGRG